MAVRALLLVVVALLWLWLRRANELCVVRVANGRARVSRGRAPSSLVAEVDEIAHRAGLTRATIRIVSEAGTPRVLPSRDLSDAVVQQLRNVVGRFQLVQFRHGRDAR